MNKKIFLLIMLFFSFCLIASPVLILAANEIYISNPLGSNTDLGKLILKIAEAIGGLISSIGIIMIIVSGIMYATSAGSAEKMGKAKITLIYAIIGIVVGIAASTIVSILLTIIGT